MKVKLLSHVRPSATPWTAAFQAPPSMGFSRQEYWSGVLSFSVSHASKVIFKILQARLQQYKKQALPDVEAGFRKGRGTRDQIANIQWNIEKSKGIPEKHLLLHHYTKVFDCVQQTGKILEIGIPNHLTCSEKPVCRSRSNS